MVLSEFKNLMLPWRTAAFYRGLHPRSLGKNIVYVVVLGLSIFLGQLLLYGVFGVNLSVGGGGLTYSIGTVYSMDYSAWIALGAYLDQVIRPLVLGLVISLFGMQLAGRVVPLEEAVTIACYAYTPALLLGVFTAFFGMGTIIWIAGMMYSTLLLFIGARASFDRKQSGLYVIFVGFATFMIVGAVVGMIFDILTQSLYGEVEPVSAYSALSGGKGTMIWGIR